MENFNFCAVRKSYYYLPKNQYCQCGVPIVKNTFVADSVTQIVKKKSLILSLKPILCIVLVS